VLGWDMFVEQLGRLVSEREDLHAWGCVCVVPCLAGGSCGVGNGGVWCRARLGAVHGVQLGVWRVDVCVHYMLM
jgi:hypothetical protein